MAPLTEKVERVQALDRSIMSCSRCPYKATRVNPITGQGDPRAPIVVIGGASRQVDDRDNTPFAGRAGLKLAALLQGAELSPAATYTTLAVKCYGGRLPDFPVGAAAKRCRTHVVSLMRAMHPRVVVLCGLHALKWVLLRWTTEKADDKTFPSWVGRAYRFKEMWGDTKFFVIHNPTDLARARDADAEEKSIEVLKVVKSYVISQQRGTECVLTLVDLRSRRGRDQQAKVDWSNPGELLK